MSELKYNEPAERFAPIVEKSLYAGATAVMVSTEDGCWVHYAKYCQRIYNIKSELDKVIAHHKYKRCIDKIKWCEERISRYTLQQEIQGISWQKEIKFYRRLQNKFIEISKQFKEAIK